MHKVNRPSIEHDTSVSLADGTRPAPGNLVFTHIPYEAPDGSVQHGIYAAKLVVCSRIVDPIAKSELMKPYCFIEVHPTTPLVETAVLNWGDDRKILMASAENVFGKMKNAEEMLPTHRAMNKKQLSTYINSLNA